MYPLAMVIFRGPSPRHAAAKVVFGLNLDGLNKNLSKLSAGMLRQGLLNSHNDFV